MAARSRSDANLPVIVTQMERFRYRLEFWRQRKQELGVPDGRPEGSPT
jgi:hypothetical protein